MMVIPQRFLSDIFFSMFVRKYIDCDVYRLRFSFKFSSVLCITPTYTSPMQDLLMQGMQYKL